MSLVHQMFSQQNTTHEECSLMLSKRKSQSLSTVVFLSIRKVKTVFCLFDRVSNYQLQKASNDLERYREEKTWKEKCYSHISRWTCGSGARKRLCWLRDCEISFMKIDCTGNTTKLKFIKYLPFSNVAVQWLWNWRKYFCFLSNLWHVNVHFVISKSDSRIAIWSKCMTGRRTRERLTRNWASVARARFTIKFNLIERLKFNKVQLKPSWWLKWRL